MEYLKSSSVSNGTIEEQHAKLLGINHEVYALVCEKKGNSNHKNLYTKYEYDTIEHSETKDIALCIKFVNDLPLEYQLLLTNKQQMLDEGWIL